MENRPTHYPNRGTIEAYACQYSLILPARQRASLIGELLGKRAGSSIEYHDRRDYAAGDDLRHIDWRAFARNDRLMVKLYQEEIRPNVDIIVDTSLSMSVTDEKSLRRMDLAYLFYLLALKEHAATAVYEMGNRMNRLRDTFDLLSIEDLRQDSPMPLLQSAPMVRKGGLKVLISDFLFPFSPAELASAFSGADRLVLVQTLSSFEHDPERSGSIRLVDAETNEYLDVNLSAANVAQYKKRLELLRNDLDRFSKLRGGSFAVIRDTDPADDMMRQLLQKNILEI